MRLSWAPLLALGTCVCALQRRDYDTRDYFAVHLHESSLPSDVAQSLEAQLEGPLGSLPDHYTFSCPKHLGSSLEDTLQDVQRKRRKRRRSLGSAGTAPRTLDHSEGVLWHQKQELKQRHVKRVPAPPPEYRQAAAPSTSDVNDTEKAAQEAARLHLDEIATTLNIQDPTFKEQWHLFNPVQLGHDLNVTGVWMDGITGNGSITAVIDDGLDMYSDDLKANYFAAGSYDFNEHTEEPKPRLFDDKHGTRCAGEIAAVKNNVCGVGMAYDSRIAGIRILSKPISDEDEATALNYHFQENQIYSCSWGPPDDGKTMEGPGVLIRRAMLNGIQQGRGGNGSVFVFAAGNGASSEDNCNFDGYTNSIYSITVGGIDRAGNHPYYSERCSAQLVVTYSSGNNDAIHTTDVGVDKCYSGHGGTSAAGPLVAGSVALALGVRPDLSWRDVQYLVIEAAVPIHLDDGDWQDTKVGKKFSHTFGYGKMDTWQFIEAAKTWKSVKPQAWYHSPWLSVNHEIPQGDQGLASSFDVTAAMLETANLVRLEHVTVTMNIKHMRRGDLSVDLRSPEGVISHIATTRRFDEAQTGYDDWTFMSVVHWGETGIGTWTVIVKDTNVNELNGTFTDWRLNLWGECIDPIIQELHPMPDEHDDDHGTAIPDISTTSIAPSSQTDLPATPTDHIDRPTKPKPDASGTNTLATQPSTMIPTSTSEAEVAEPTHTVSDSFLPSFFPTFGFGAKTQIWIYGSIVLIVLFCAGLGAYFLFQRRRQRRQNPRDDYEFEVLDDDDPDAPAGMNGHAAGKTGKRRAGELYAAFRESDDDLFSDEDEDEEQYKDLPREGEGAGQVEKGGH
jgi:kexin